MRNEVLRMERVTYKEDEVVKLKDFNLQIFQGEIMGFLPVNSHGKNSSSEASGTEPSPL